MQWLMVCVLASAMTTISAVSVRNMEPMLTTQAMSCWKCLFHVPKFEWVEPVWKMSSDVASRSLHGLSISEIQLLLFTFFKNILLCFATNAFASACWSYQLFLSVLLFSVHSCFYSKPLRHWMAFYVLMCRYKLLAHSSSACLFWTSGTCLPVASQDRLFIVSYPAASDYYSTYTVTAIILHCNHTHCL